MHYLAKFLGNSAGGVAVTFALSSLGLALTAGCATDYIRWQHAQTELQVLVDTAALAAGASEQTSAATLKTIAANYIEANKAGVGIEETDTPVFEVDEAKKRVSVTVRGRMKTAFMSLAGISSMELYAASTVQQRRMPPIEAVLVLDTTYSMVGTKITTLKTAAKNLTKSILANKKARVGIVPFASYVNVGVSRRDEPWADVPADSSKTYESCSTTYPNRTGCVTTSSTSTCSSTRDGITTTYSCTKSTTTCASNGEPVKSCKVVTATTKFYGCVGSREEKHRPVVSNPKSEYPGMMNTSCAKEILELTSDQGAVDAKIDSLTVDGETYLPGGITWGWNMLTDEAPLTSALPMADLKGKGGKKVLVIMTDGTNTLAPVNRNAGPHGSANSGTYKGTKYPDQLSAELCANVKNNEIDVYTVLFEVEDEAIKQLLQDCASSKSKSYVAKDAEELIAAFNAIAKQLAQIRVVN